ncbi:helix-turn-helix transcriptional regulator [Frankia sp. CiP3]|uniref:helix-turn-helix domain-containing protein n=1 Tax=Frankia sp. CiP3 TaxID=2880971 RepID=UPI001EF5DF39|nr:helix-turn-helix transcriptional regulator [Frankia sp. CiP3]
MDDGGTARKLADRIRELRRAAGYSQERLAARLGYQRAYLSQAESGRDVPSQTLIDALDTALDAGGELRTLRGQAWQERQARRIGLPGPRRDRREDSTDRRQVFELAAAGVLAADTYRRWTATGPDPLTVAEIEDQVDQHAAIYTTTAHDALAPMVYRTWWQAETQLREATRLRAHRRLTVAAGSCAYMLCRLAFNMDDHTASRRFLTLAGDHAEDAEEPVLAASVAEMASTLAFYGGRYEEAARVAAEAAQRFPHPYTAARLAAYEARAHAVLGDERSTRAALERMRRDAVGLGARPGMAPFAPNLAEVFAGGVLARLGAGDEAEPIARAALTQTHGLGFEDQGHALLGLAVALATRTRPAPDEAAAVAARAVAVLADRPTFSVMVKAREVAAGLAPWHEVSEVRDYCEQVRALPPGGSV